MDNSININPLSTVMGAEITGINLSSTIDKKIIWILLWKNMNAQNFPST